MAGSTLENARNPSARFCADRNFGRLRAPYTGLKPAGRDLGPAIPAADKALETGSDEAVIQLLTTKVQEGLRNHFKEVIEKKNFATDDVAAGREFVESYVTYIHYVEGLYEAAAKPITGHYPETD